MRDADDTAGDDRNFVTALARGLAANPDTAEAVFQPAVDIIVIWQSAQ